MDSLIVQASLLRVLKIESFIPLYFGAMVAHQLSKFEDKKSISLEAIINFIKKIIQTCWIKLFTDYLIDNVNLPAYLHKKKQEEIGIK